MAGEINALALSQLHHRIIFNEQKETAPESSRD
jgi:hypothetical protein